jgi:hypothetical protein
LFASLTTIGNYAFIGCDGLASITRWPRSLTLVGGGLGTNAVIYVPAASLDAYKNAEGWKEHADRIRDKRP